MDRHFHDVPRAFAGGVHTLKLPAVTAALQGIRRAPSLAAPASRPALASPMLQEA